MCHEAHAVDYQGRACSQSSHDCMTAGAAALQHSKSPWQSLCDIVNLVLCQQVASFSMASWWYLTRVTPHLTYHQITATDSSTYPASCSFALSAVCSSEPRHSRPQHRWNSRFLHLLRSLSGFNLLTLRNVGRSVTSSAVCSILRRLFHLRAPLVPLAIFAAFLFPSSFGSRVVFLSRRHALRSPSALFTQDVLGAHLLSLR